MRPEIVYKLLKFLSTALKHQRSRPCSAAYVFDARTGRLRVGARELTLRPKTAALFSAIAAEPGRVFSKSELLDRFWPGLHVQDQAIFQCVNEIRQAFGSKSCIRTHARLGYQWAGPFAPQTDERPRLSLKRSAAVLASASALFVAGALNSDSAPAPAEKPVRVAVLPAQVDSPAPKDHGLSLALMEMITRHGASIAGAEFAPDRDTLSRSRSAPPRERARMRRALKADVIVSVSISRRGEALVAQFEIEGRDGAVAGAYESASPPWLAHQIVYEINNAVQYSMTRGLPDASRIARHQGLIAAKQFMHKQEPAAARRILKDIAAGDPAFLSAQYFLMLADSDLGATVSGDGVERLRDASRADRDGVNEIRSLLLAARKASQDNDPLASSYMTKGRALAARSGLHFLGAAFEFQDGAALAADGAFDRAAASFHQAIAQYRLADCAVGLIAAYERLENTYRAAGDELAAKAASGKLRALQELMPETAATRRTM